MNVTQPDKDLPVRPIFPFCLAINSPASTPLLVMLAASYSKYFRAQPTWSAAVILVRFGFLNSHAPKLAVLDGEAASNSCNLDLVINS